MAINKKVALPLIILLLAALAGGGWYFLQHRGHDHAAEGKGGVAKSQYTCPMHPFIVKETPGVCPICNMELVKKVEGTQMSADDKEKLGEIALSPSQQVIANVATVKAEKSPLMKEITAVGIIAFDQSRQAKVTSWVAGRLDRLHVATVGETVSKTRPVAEIYSPDLVAAQQEYLLALRSRDQLKQSAIPSIANGSEGLVSSARQRLKLLGVTDEQLAGLEKAGQPNIRLNIYTPISGVVIEKLVQQGQYVNVGEPLFNVADLSRVWVELDIFESDLGSVRVGQSVEIMPQSYPGRTFKGRVAFINPFLDPKTRTVKVRVETGNPGMMLKPEMFVNARLNVPLGSAVVVPVAALMDTGRRQVVWVEVKPGHYSPRDVQAGERVGDRVQILSGLQPGEVVAAQGGYLIDSEAQLSGGGGQDHSQHAAPKPAESRMQSPATPAKKDSLTMDDMKM